MIVIDEQGFEYEAEEFEKMGNVIKFKVSFMSTSEKIALLSTFSFISTFMVDDVPYRATRLGSANKKVFVEAQRERCKRKCCK